jgi:hypothetical protein
VFDKLKKTLNERVEQARDMRSHPGPADLMALPPSARAAGGLGVVTAEVIGAYVGLEVKTVAPLDRLGPESSSLIGDKIRSRMRAAGVGDPNLPPGELVAGQNEARMARLRAEGLSEEQLALIAEKISEVTAEHQRTGWTIEFVNGNRASVQLFDPGTSGSGFTGLQSKYASQHTRAGAMAMQRNATEFAVNLIDASPYEAYYLPGTLSAKGRTHEAEAKASHLGTMQLDLTLAALANLALFSLEG